MDFRWLEQLQANGYAVLDQFLPLEKADQLSRLALQKRQSGLFRPAGIGKKQDYQLSTEIRGDEVLWWDDQDGASLAGVEKEYLDRLNELKSEINQNWFLGLWDWEGHYAHYPVGRYYKKHVDRFKTDDARVLSTVYYLNSDWNPDKGGQLTLFTENSATPIEVEPYLNRLVVFFSDRIPHEVVPAKADRYSVTGWFRRRPMQ